MKIMTTIRKSVSGQNPPETSAKSIVDTEDAHKAFEGQENTEQEVQQAQSAAKAEAANHPT